MEQAKRNLNWVWLFVVLGVLSAAAVAINLSFNLRQQLAPAELQAARRKWEANGPADYDLTVMKELSSAGSDGVPARDELRMRVRSGRVTEATLNSRPLESRLWAEYDMPGWFDAVERFLQKDREPGAPRVFCTARFHPADGHLTSFVRSVRSTRERQELKFDLKPVK